MSQRCSDEAQCIHPCVCAAAVVWSRSSKWASKPLLSAGRRVRRQNTTRTLCSNTTRTLPGAVPVVRARYEGTGGRLSMAALQGSGSGTRSGSARHHDFVPPEQFSSTRSNPAASSSTGCPAPSTQPFAAQPSSATLGQLSEPSTSRDVVVYRFKRLASFL